MAANVVINIDNNALRAAVLRGGRRSAAQRIRRAGELARRNAITVAHEDLHVRHPDRRRVNGAHYHDSFGPVLYHHVADLEGGAPLSFEITNDHPMARLIEHGSPGHTIRPRKGSKGGKKQGRLTMPKEGSPQWLPGPPWSTLGPGQAVTHPGTRDYRIMENAVKSALKSTFGVSGRKRS